MNWLDIVLIIFLAIVTIIGLKKGLIKAVLTVAGMVGGVVLAGRYYIPLSERLTFISSPTLAKVAAFAIILVGVMIIAAILAWLLGRLASALLLGWANHLGGAILGLVFGGILAGTVLALWIKYVGMAGAVNESRIAAILLDYVPLVLALLPEDFASIRSLFQKP